MELFKRKIVELPLLRGVGEFAQHNLEICQEKLLVDHPSSVSRRQQRRLALLTGMTRARRTVSRTASSASASAAWREK
jgi:hypothetical protein